LNRLTALDVRRAKDRGYLCDGGGLYLQITPTGYKSWVFRFRDGGKLREMGLGSVPIVSLAEARTLAEACRKQRAAGLDPITERHKAWVTAKLSAENAKTFRQCAEAFVEAHKAGWKHPRHEGQWRASFEAYVYPKLGKLPVSVIDTGMIVRTLEPIWTTKPTTAVKLRGRIENVLDWARVRGYRDGDNPARWRGHLDQLLPEPGKVRRTAHHAALPYAEMPAFMDGLRAQPGIIARALEFAVLTAARTGEVLGATWEEIDLDNAVWTVPAARMKAGREHRVPLSDAALALLRPLSAHPEPLVFPGHKFGRPLGDLGMIKLLRRMGHAEITVHGFRSTFRDWVAEATDYPNEVAEMALAHTVGNKVEAAYRRGDLFDKRRGIMEDWAKLCGY